MAVVVATVLAGLGGCGDDPEGTPVGLPAGAFPPAGDTVDAAPLPSVEVTMTRVAAVGEMVTGLVSDPNRDVLFVTSRTGRIYRVPIEEVEGVAAPRTGAPDVMIDLSESISTADERGLFDIEVVDGGDRVAVSYTGPEGEVTVRLLRRDGTTLVDDVPDPIVFSVPHPFGGHNGGGLASTGDGDLLLSLGDMDSRETSAPIAQDPSLVLGGIVRLPAEALADGPRPVPVDPDLLIAKGLRNPWRIHVDPAEDDLWIGDVGQETWEEIDLLASVTDQTSIADFGWPAFEGDKPFNGGVDTIGAPPVGPVHTYEHGEGRCAVTLGPRYRGTAVEGLDGALLFGDFCESTIRAFRPDEAGRAEPIVLAELDEQIVVSFSQDARNEVYVLTDRGEVWRIDPATWSPPDVTAAADPTGGDQGDTGAPVPTTVPPPTPEECRAIAAILDLARYEDLPPADLERSLTEVLASLSAAEPTAPPSRRAGLARLKEVFGIMQDEVAAVGYQTSDPGFQDLRDEILTGTARAEGFPEAMTTVMDAGDSCS